MSTVFVQFVLLSLLLAACGSAPAPIPAAPAPPADSAPVAGTDRTWQRIRVDGPYGTFEMHVPALSISPLEGGAGSMMIDSIALQEVERQLKSRIARIARSQAAALLPADAGASAPRRPALAIRSGLIGAITFEGAEFALDSAADQRIAAVAQLALALPGRLEIVAEAAGSGVAVADIALGRARRVYLALLEAAPRLAEREVSILVRTRSTALGARAPVTAVEIYGGAAR